MTALSGKIDGLTRALTPLVRELLLEEIRQHAAAERKAEQDEIDREINEASRAVAHAYDQFVSARFSGAPERAAHGRLVKSAANLGEVMRRHGRMPKGG